MLNRSEVLVALVMAMLLTSVAVALQPTRDHDIVPEDYFDIASIFAFEVSPDGSAAAYVESRWGTGEEGRFNDLWVVNLESGERSRLTFDGFGPGHLSWSADGAWIYFSGSDPHGDNEAPPHDGSTQVWRVPAAGGQPFAVTRVKDGISRFELAPNGEALFYTAAEEVYDEQWKELREEYDHLEYGHGVGDRHGLWRLDLEGWRSEQLLEAEEVIHEIALSPDQKRLAIITTDDNELIFKEGWSRVAVMDLASREVEIVTGDGWRSDHPSPYGWLENITWSGDSRGLAFSVGFDGFATLIYAVEWLQETTSLFEVARPHPVAFSGGLKWRNSTRDLCYVGEDRARVRAYCAERVVNGHSGETTTLTPGDVAVGYFDFSADGKEIAATVGTTNHLEDIFRVVDGKLHRVTNLNPQVDRWKLPQIKIVSWKGADGDTVEGILELPPDYSAEDGPLPLVVELHGGPTASTFYRLQLWIYGRSLMASNGFALLSPNYHGSTGYGDEFTAELIGRENEIEVTDIRTGIEDLVKKGIADRERIGVMGWSNGGFLTNAMITAEPDLFKAASSGAGVLDQLLQWAIEDTPGHVINYMQGLPWEQPEAYQKGSPVFGLGKVKTPTLIHVGGNDPRVPPAHSRALYRALRHYLNVPVELVVYPGEGHGLSTHDNRLAKMKWDLAWFEEYLTGEGDSAD